MKNNRMLWSVQAMTAAIMLLRVRQAKKIADSVFRPIKGVKPKKMPIATPPAMAPGVSRIASSLSECSRSQRCRFMSYLRMVSVYWRVAARAQAEISRLELPINSNVLSRGKMAAGTYQDQRIMVQAERDKNVGR